MSSGMTNEEIKKIALDNGFVLKHRFDGKENVDLHPYVYCFARALLAAAPTPPAQEDEPFLWQCDFDDESKYVSSKELADKYASLGWRITKLYTRPSNDKLRKAAENAAYALEQLHRFTGASGSTEKVLAEALRAALEGK